MSLRSEEHTSELQSHLNLVCRLLLEKKNNCSVMSRSMCAVLCTCGGYLHTVTTYTCSVRHDAREQRAMPHYDLAFSLFFFKEPGPPEVFPSSPPPPPPV